MSWRRCRRRARGAWPIPAALLFEVLGGRRGWCQWLAVGPLEAGISATTHISQRWVVSKLRDANRTVYISTPVQLPFIFRALIHHCINFQRGKGAFSWDPSRDIFMIDFHSTTLSEGNGLTSLSCAPVFSVQVPPSFPAFPTFCLFRLSLFRISPVSTFKRFLTTSIIDSQPRPPFPNTQPGYMQLVQQPPRIPPSYP